MTYDVRPAGKRVPSGLTLLTAHGDGAVHFPCRT